MSRLEGLRGGDGTWQKESAIPDRLGGCGTCDRPADVFPLDGQIVVGFGEAHVLRDGVVVLDGEAAMHTATDWDQLPTGRDAEKLAAADPDHDWRIRLNAPLSERIYQRQGPGNWVLIHRGQGFA